jgi:hypothetical protein
MRMWVRDNWWGGPAFGRAGALRTAGTTGISDGGTSWPSGLALVLLYCTTANRQGVQESLASPWTLSGIGSVDTPLTPAAVRANESARRDTGRW